MKLPEPIEMPRTQNLNAKIRIAAEALPIIGASGGTGVGSPLQPYVYNTDNATSVNLPQLPFATQLGLVGRRVKKTQYGQIPGQTPGAMTPPAPGAIPAR